LLEHKIKKELLALPCRYHIYELVAAKAFETVIETSTSGPQIELFQRLAAAWSVTYCAEFESSIIDD